MGLWLSGQPLSAQPAAVADSYFEVVLNSQPLGVVLRCRQQAQGWFIARADHGILRLREDRLPAGAWVALDAIPGVSYQVDEARQQLRVTVAAESMAVTVLDAAPHASLSRPQAPWGQVLNYTLYAQDSRAEQDSGSSTHQATQAVFGEYRLFGPYGSVSSTAVLRQVNDETRGTRLDTVWTWSDTDRLTTWQLGDMVTSGLPWTRPLRIGGLQWRRNFALQPNLVVFPVPVIGGTAAVPSTVEVYLDNLRQYSGEVPAGPYSIQNLPTMTGQGELQVVVRDVLGREQITTLPFYSAPQLLRAGLTDFSLEAGYVRQRYGLASDDYAAPPAALATWRHGLTQALTLESHLETGASLTAFGGGVVQQLGSAGVLSAALANSHSGSGQGWLAAMAYQFTRRGYAFYAAYQAASPSYRDLAAESGAPVAREQIQLNASAGLDDASTIGIGYLKLQRNADLLPASGLPCTVTTGCLGQMLPQRSEVASLYYNRRLRVFDREATVYASAFRELNERGSGFSLGITLPLAPATHLSSELQTYHGQPTVNLQAAKPAPLEGEGAGWRMQYGSADQSLRGLGVAYRNRWAYGELGVNYFGQSRQSYAQLQGAVVGLQGVYLANAIYDSFAVVDTGEPGVTVLHENRPLGKSDRHGHLLVTQLNAHQINRLSIDPLDLPADVVATTVKEVATPADRAGMVVTFPVQRPQAALLQILLRDGQPLPLGARLWLNGVATSQSVGYDGLIYLTSLQATNAVVVDYEGRQCRFEFPYTAIQGQAQRLGPFTCQASTVPQQATP